MSTHPFSYKAQEQRAGSKLGKWSLRSVQLMEKCECTRSLALDTERMWINPIRTLIGRWPTKGHLFTRWRTDFIIRTPFMDTHRSHLQRTFQELFASVRDCHRKIHKQTYGTTDLPIVLSWCGIRTLWLLPLYQTRPWPPPQHNGVWRPTMIGTFLIINHEA